MRSAPVAHLTARALSMGTPPERFAGPSDANPGGAHGRAEPGAAAAFSPGWRTYKLSSSGACGTVYALSIVVGEWVAEQGWSTTDGASAR